MLMIRRFTSPLAAILLAAPLMAQGTSATPAPAGVQAQDAMAALKTKDQQALAAYQALGQKLQQDQQKAAKTEEGGLAFLKDAREQFLALAHQWKGTDASLMALYQVGSIDIQALQEKERGLKVLDEFYEGSKARPKAILESSQVTPGPAGLQYVQLLLQEEHFDRATTVLKELVSMDIPESDYAKQQLAQVDTLKNLKVGNKLPHFAGQDLDGAELTPEQYQGKVVLVDFWATWCGPCRAEMPNVVRIYNKYHDQGFDIIGVTLDQANQADKVRTFTKDHGMPWRQVYDGGGWKAKVAAKFGINSIPATFLLDRKGVIRYKNVRGEELATAVATLIGAQP